MTEEAAEQQLLFDHLAERSGKTGVSVADYLARFRCAADVLRIPGRMFERWALARSMAEMRFGDRVADVNATAAAQIEANAGPA